MLFNSIEFLIFFSILVVLYFSIAQKFRWMLLLGASYYFYMSWKPEYVLLILFTSLVSYYCGIWMHNAKTLKKRKHFLWLSLAINLGVLFFFKYFNFMNDGVREILQSFSLHYSFDGLDILLPIGISFYTFQTVGYNLDVFYQVRKPEKHFGIFALFVSFFPQLIAGPIERSTVLLPQFKKEHHYDLDRVKHGLKYIIWGLFKKLVIADRLVPIIGEAYGNVSDYSGSTLWFGTFLYAIQLYADFSAYSEIAKGLAKILGYDLMDNFDHPFKSKNITEFWRRWHISLSFWLRDYLYNPILFAKKKWGKPAVIYSLFITFILCGVWHGTKFTYIIFGLLQAIILTFEMLTKKWRKNLQKSTPKFFYNNLSMLLTFGFTLFSFSFFRAATFSDSIVITKALTSSLFDFKDLWGFIKTNGGIRFAFSLLLVVSFLATDTWIFKQVQSEKTSSLQKYLIFPLLIAFIFLFGFFGEVEFIYFQF
jgi:alginate O-acetyltransferase complex protein AlgI